DLANLLIVAHNLQQARQQTDVLLKNRPNDPVVHVLLANLLAGEENFPAAIAEIQKALALDPARWDSYVNLGLLQVKNNQAGTAEASFRKAVELNSNGAGPRMMLASYYQSQGNFASAEEQFRAAITNDPKDPEPRAALARLYLAQGKSTVA